MFRRNLIQHLQAHEAFDEREHAMCDAIIQFVQAYENCAARELQIGHLTGSAWIVDQDLTHTLLRYHRKLNLWVQLGGHVEDDADMFSVSLREAREESGLQDLQLLVPHIFDVDIHTIPALRDEPGHFHYDIRYAFRAERDARLTVSSESRKLAWVAFDEIESLTREESILRMTRKTAELKREFSTKKS
jgi:8-oxo-dGTP pyrophosphatase MutT (NUDIX family)